MFDFDELSDKVSELKLSDIIEIGATERDYEVDDCEDNELKRPVGVTLNPEIVTLSGYLIKKLKCSSNIFYKSATKLGAIILEDSKLVKPVDDIGWFVELLVELAGETGDDSLLRLVVDFTNRLSLACTSVFKDRDGGSYVRTSIYPYPRWRKALDRYCYLLYVPKTVVYRGAIALAVNTEIKCETADKFYNKLNIFLKERLMNEFVHFIKFSSGFIKNREYIVNKIKRKKLTDDIKSVVYDVFDID